MAEATAANATTKVEKRETIVNRFVERVASGVALLSFLGDVHSKGMQQALSNRVAEELARTVVVWEIGFRRGAILLCKNYSSAEFSHICGYIRARVESQDWRKRMWLYATSMVLIGSEFTYQKSSVKKAAIPFWIVLLMVACSQGFFRLSATRI